MIYSTQKYKSLVHYVCLVEPGRIPNWILSTECDVELDLTHIISGIITLSILMTYSRTDNITFSLMLIGWIFFVAVIQLPFMFAEERARRRLQRGMSVYPDYENDENQ